MEILLTILTSTLLSVSFFAVYRLGYRDGKNHKETEGITVSKDNKKMLKEYINFVSYDGNERGR